MSSIEELKRQMIVARVAYENADRDYQDADSKRDFTRHAWIVATDKYLRALAAPKEGGGK